ncbi:MAG: serine/threonine protein kinase, partial [Actinomycetota bacterium]|nr:serine/threonine protein kinase [Actinomycetota bacterium]
SLGCIAFECLAGSPPFAGKSIFQVGRAHLEEAPPDPASGREDVSDALSWAVLQALNKDPGGRPPTATAYATMLRVAAGTTWIAPQARARPPSPS